MKNEKIITFTYQGRQYRLTKSDYEKFKQVEKKQSTKQWNILQMLIDYLYK